MRVSKFDRIHSPAKLGLNTEMSVLIKSIEDLTDRNIPRSNYYSVRCMCKENARYGHVFTPHYPWIKATKLPSVCQILLNSGFYPIVAVGIDPRDCLYAGVLCKHGAWWVIEVAHGPGTVRRVTHENKIDKRWTADSNNDMPPECNELLMRLRHIPECVVEFSIYAKPVGHLKQPLIVWELAEVGI